MSTIILLTNGIFWKIAVTFRSNKFANILDITCGEGEGWWGAKTLLFQFKWLQLKNIKQGDWSREMP